MTENFLTCYMTLIVDPNCTRLTQQILNMALIVLGDTYVSLFKLKLILKKKASKNNDKKKQQRNCL